MRPLIAELVEHVNVAKGAEDAAHESGFADRFLHAVETRANDGFGAYDTSDRACHFTKNIICSCHGFLPRSNRVDDLLGCFKSWIYDGYGNHPDTVLHALRKHSYFGEEALVRWAGHDLVGIPLRAAVGTYNDYCWPEILDKVPASTCDGEDICVCADVSENFECGMMLEQEIHFYTDSTDILKHIRKLHIFRV